MSLSFLNVDVDVVDVTVEDSVLIFFSFTFFFFNFNFYFVLLYNTVLVLPYIDMNQTFKEVAVMGKADHGYSHLVGG